MSSHDPVVPRWLLLTLLAGAIATLVWIGCLAWRRQSIPVLLSLHPTSNQPAIASQEPTAPPGIP